MPLYSAKCSSHDCNKNQTYFSKIADRNTTPACDGCGSPTERVLDTPMITAMGLSDHFQVVSPIDGTTLYGRSAYYDHMKKHNVVPESELRGEAEHRQKAMKKEQAKQRKATIEKVVSTTLKP